MGTLFFLYATSIKLDVNVYSVPNDSYSVIIRCTSVATGNDPSVTTVFDTYNDLQLKRETTTSNGATLHDAPHGWDIYGNPGILNGTQGPSPYNIGADDRLLSDVLFSYQYDGNGSLTRKTQGTSPPSNSYEEFQWNHRGKMKSARGFVNGVLQWEELYRYDAADRNVETILLGPTGVPIKHKHAIYDGFEMYSLVMELEEITPTSPTGSERITMTALHGAAVDMVLAEDRWDYSVAPPKLNLTWPLADYLGSINAVQGSDSNGAPTIVSKVERTAFGKEIQSTGTPGNFGYQAHPQNKQTGQAEFRNRNFSTHQARFTSQDPIRFASRQTNFYALANNHPHMGTDPSGLQEPSNGTRIYIDPSIQFTPLTPLERGLEQERGRTHYLPIPYTVDDYIRDNPAAIWQSTDLMQYFNDSLRSDYLTDADFILPPRASGALRIIGGAISAAVAMGLTETIVGAAVGVPLAAWAGDQMGTGLKEMYTNESHYSLGAGLAHAFGNGPGADWAAFGYDVLPGLIGTGSIRSLARLGSNVDNLAPVSAAKPQLNILNPHFTPDPVRVLQNVTNQAVSDLAQNPSIARNLMSAGSYRHLVQGTNLADASYGKAVERLAADIVKKDTMLSSILQHQSRPFRATPDFFGYEGYNLHLIDITTLKSIPNHLKRSYGPATNYVTHPGLTQGLVFPK